MNRLQMTKKALISYVNAVKFIWSELAHPLTIVSKKFMNLRDYKIYGNSVQGKGKNLFNEETVTSGVYIDDTGAEHESTATGLRLSDYIEVKPFINYSLILTNATTSAVNARISFYDAEQVFVSQIVYSISAGTSSTKSIQIAEDIYYVRISFAGDIKFYEGVNPENPIEIQSVGELVTEGEYTGKYRVPVRARGKNLWDKESYPMTIGIWVNAASGNPSESNSYCSTRHIPCVSLQGKTITLSPTGGQNPGVAFYDANYGYISGKAYGNNAYCTVTVPEDAIYMRFSSPVSNKEIFMVELGNTATAYEPYIEPQTLDIYLDAPLRKVGNYKDYIDFENGRVVRNVGKKVFDGTEIWYHEVLTYGNNFYTKITDAIKNQNIPIFCNMGRYFNTGNLTPVYACRISASQNFNLRYQDCNNLQSFKNKLTEFYNSGNPLYTIYCFGVPKETPIELPKLPQFKGTTIYEVDTEIKPSGMEVKYC